MHPVDVAGRTVGPGAPCFVAVEVGLNHNGDLGLAHRMVDAAADAGVDGVKFQNYRTEDFIFDRSITYEYVSGGATVRETQYEMFKRYELDRAAWLELRDHCADRGVVFFATPTGEDGLEELLALGVPLLKNGSDYLLHAPLVRAMARSGVPTVLSTGMATEAEVATAVDVFRDAGGERLVLLHCTSSYPTPPDEVNLRAIPALAATFDCPVGLSDHTDGVTAAIGAVVLGGCFLEKHFTLDRSLPGPDHRFSADPEELRRLVESVRTVEQALGDGRIGPTPSEQQGREDFRLSCVAARALESGHVVAEADVAFRRPGTGVPPTEARRLIGRRLGRALRGGDVFDPEDLS